MKVGLFSVTYSGIFYRGGGLSTMEVLRRAHAFGYDGVEVGGKRPHGNPMDLDDRRRRAIRELAAELGLDILCLAAYGDYTSPVTEQREANLLMLREQIRLARDLGAPLVRVYAACAGTTVRDGLASYDIARRRWEETWRDTTWLEAWNYCKQALREAVRYAEDDGVLVVLQNHPPVIRQHLDVLDMLAEVDSPWLRACIDAPLLTQQDDAYVRQAVLATGALEAHTHVGDEYARGPDGRVVPRQYRRDRPPTNYRAFVGALHEIGYAGYLSFELCHPVLDRNREPATIEYVDEQARLALEYFRALLVEVQGSVSPAVPEDPVPAAAARA